jgi:hypothetical protein
MDNVILTAALGGSFALALLAQKGLLLLLFRVIDRERILTKGW